MLRPMYERRRLDRTDHRREVESRRHDERRPSESAIDKALEAVADHDVPGTPPTGALKVLSEVHSDERTTDTRRVRSISITRGRPRHGALRSDDHIGTYEVELPLAEVDDGAVSGDLCPECGHERGVYGYQAHHHIAGGDGIECLQCEADLYADSWG